MSIKALIKAGIFVKICDCIMEVKKVKMDHSVTNATDEEPIHETKKIKLEEPEVEMTPNAKHTKELNVYRHKGSGYYFTLSKSLKVIGRLSKEKEAIFEGKTVHDLIDEGELRRVVRIIYYFMQIQFSKYQKGFLYSRAQGSLEIKLS